MSSPFDLRRFAPPAETTFQLRKHGGQVFRVDGDPEVDDVAAMLRIENVVTGREEGDSAEAFAEGKALLLRLVQETDPDVTDLKVGAQELLIVFALIVHGASVAEAVMESVTASNLAAAVDASREGDGEDIEPEEEPAAPLASAKRSSDRSSSSAKQEAGLQATGTG